MTAAARDGHAETGEDSPRISQMPLLLNDDVRLGHVRAECADNLSLLASLKDRSVNLVVTSPPYNIGKEYEDRVSLEEWLDGQAAVIDECVRVLAVDGSVCWQVGNHVNAGEVVPLDCVLYPLFADRGLVLRNRIVWHFEHGLHCSNRLSGRHETILWWTRPGEYKFRLDPIRVPSKYPNKRHFKGPRVGELSGNPLGKNPGDVWAVPNVKHNHVEKTAHPCQFPVELPERLVLALTDEGDTVLDPYMGVGSTLIAAVMHGRDAIGCDIDDGYTAIARERLRALTEGRLRTRPMGRPVSEPQGPQQQPAVDMRTAML